MIDRGVIKRALICGVALGALLDAGASAAAPLRDAAAPAADEGTQDEGTQSAGSDASENDLNTIIVTANKRSESLIKVPQSMTAIGGDALSYRNQATIQDLAGQVPGFNLQAFGNKGIKLVLRGINAGATAATSAVVIDETPFSYQSGLALGDRNTANIDTFDMSRIEVLKGPQGTLYGASAEGGLLKYVTNKPNLQTFEAAVEASAETVRQGQVGGGLKAMVNLPFWDGKGAVRASGFYTRVPGYIDNLLMGDDDANRGRRYGGRISVLLEPTDGFSIRFTGMRQDQRFFDDGNVDVIGADADPLNPPPNQFDIAYGGRLVHSSLYGNPSNNVNELANVAYLTLTHVKTIEWADSATDNPRHGGLTPFGEKVVTELNRLGMLVDLSYVSEDTMRDALAVSKAPVIFSHSGARGIDDHPRNVSDAVLKLVTANGGVVMVVYAPAYVSDAYRRWSADAVAEKIRLNAPPYDGLYIGQPEKAAAAFADWLKKNPSPVVTLAQVADHIEHIARIAGIDHVGIGSDFDGVDNVLPAGLGDVSTYPALLEELMRRGWSDADIAKLAGENVLRVMAEAERVSKTMTGLPAIDSSQNAAAK